MRRWFTPQLLSLAVICASGCATPAKRIDQETTTRTRDKSVGHSSIAEDPISYLRDVQLRCDALEQYRVTFHRQERLGLFQRLSEYERIQATFRREPLSIRFEWPDEKADFYECVYVAGANDDKLVVRERHGWMGLAPQVRVVDTADPVKWGCSLSPITEFGLGKLIQKTLLPYDDPDIAAVTTTTYLGLASLDDIEGDVHHIRIERPKIKSMRYVQQDIYVYADTGLPAGSDLYTASDRLAARYRYVDIDPNAQFTDTDFRLSQDHPTSSPSP